MIIFHYQTNNHNVKLYQQYYIQLNKEGQYMEKSELTLMVQFEEHLNEQSNFTHFLPTSSTDPPSFFFFLQLALMDSLYIATGVVRVRN